MSSSRLGLALVLGAFCLPLFVGLGRTDFETDEAIYSFAVDRILEIGEWLAPKSSPSETKVFLEKPPLKFWIVAAPIRAGMLPHNEFGFRFWDALFGGAAFLYVYAIGNAIAGPICGFVAILLLFVHGPLVLNHGLRTNNMESALLLSYCGGIWHFLRWDVEPCTRRGCLHAVTVGLFFVLGFMTKFVAVLFLPLVLVVSAFVVRRTRLQMAQSWRTWGWTAVLVLGLTIPWFLYAQVRFGRLLWDTMFGTHIYQRFTATLEPAHLQPWHFYFVRMFQRFAESHSEWLVLLGLSVLFIRVLVRPTLDLVVVLLWGTLPVALLSLGTSKLYHYVYPFLPPLTLAVGYVASLVFSLARAPLRKVLEAAEDIVARRVERLAVRPLPTWLLRLTSSIIWIAAILAGAAAVGFPIRFGIALGVVFKSGGLVRPLLALAAAAVVSGRSARVVPWLVAIPIVGVLPLGEYRVALSRLAVESHPLRSVRDCIADVQAGHPNLPPGLYVDGDEPIWHPVYYYLRRAQPWTYREAPSPAELDRHLHEPDSWQPSLVAAKRFSVYASGLQGYRFASDMHSSPMKLFEYMLLLPGPYAACNAGTVQNGSR